jgi:signal transduction histidine kinase/ActR/RegA family two-component response regulator
LGKTVFNFITGWLRYFRYWFPWITESRRAHEKQARLLRRLAGINQLQESLMLPAPLEEKFKMITDAAVELLDLDSCHIWMIKPGDICDAGCIHAAATDEKNVCRHHEKCLHLLANSGRSTQVNDNHLRVPLGCYEIGRIATGEMKKFLTNNATTDPHMHDRQWAKSLGLVSFTGYKLHDRWNETRGVLAMFAQHPLTEDDEAFIAHAAETTSKVIIDHFAEEELRQAQKLEGVGQLAGGIAHEFNNLLQVISNYTRYGMEGLDPQGERYGDLQQALEAADRATTLTRQLLGFSRRNVVQPKTIDANLVVRDLLKLVRPTIGGHIILKAVPCSEAVTTYADPGELKQALFNLCLNARDAMPSGGKLTIKTECISLKEPLREPNFNLPPGRYVAFSISDTGCGIPHDIQQRIFEPFFTTKEVGKGTGLGLAMVYGFVMRHKGAVRIESEVGKGTNIILHLPFEGGCAPAEPREESCSQHGGTETILIAEDDPSVRRLTVRILARAGYKVLAASDGKEALHLFKEHRSDIALVMLDVIMPYYTGHEIYCRIQDADPQMKVMLCTGYDRETAQSENPACQNTTILQKPYTAPTLLAKVREVLDAPSRSPTAAPLPVR